MKGRALLFGLNYAGTANELHGCVQDVVNIGDYIAKTLKIPAVVCVEPANTTAMSIVQGIYQLALQSHAEALDFAWIHYSGHGSTMTAGIPLLFGFDRSARGDDRHGKDPRSLAHRMDPLQTVQVPA